MIKSGRVLPGGIWLFAGLLFSGVIASGSGAAAQAPAPPFPRDGARKVNEGDRVIVWDVTRQKGKQTAMFELPLDQVSVTLAEGAVKITRRDGSSSIERERFGSVRFESKGTIRSEEGVSDTPSRAIVFQLKDGASPRWPTVEGIPGQFPRVGAVELLETDRIRVWDQTWRAGVRIVRHLHYVQTAAVSRRRQSPHDRRGQAAERSFLAIGWRGTRIQHHSAPASTRRRAGRRLAAGDLD